MPYIWLAFVLYFGICDDVWMVVLTTCCYVVAMWAVSELHAAAEHAAVFDIHVMWSLVDQAAALRGEGNP
mgnify:CR=1 FL=1